MDESWVGQWASRVAGQRDMTRYHFVQSILRGDALMKCGRLMRRSGYAGTLTLATEPPTDGQTCRQCAA